jgi:hypothetical protein
MSKAKALYPAELRRKRGFTGFKVMVRLCRHDTLNFRLKRTPETGNQATFPISLMRNNAHFRMSAMDVGRTALPTNARLGQPIWGRLTWPRQERRQ